MIKYIYIDIYIYNVYDPNKSKCMYICSMIVYVCICIICCVEEDFWLNKKKTNKLHLTKSLDITFPSDLVHSFWRLFANFRKLPNLTGLRDQFQRKINHQMACN